MSLLSKAIALAFQAHADVLDKGGRSYIYHPLDVMTALIPYGETMMVVGVLHDTHEDVPWVTKDLIRIEFGEEILRAILSVTRIKEPVKETYADFILRAAADPIGRYVKRADLLDNLRPDRMAHMTPEERTIERRYKKALVVIEDAIAKWPLISVV